jgi:hypothetical protein
MNDPVRVELDNGEATTVERAYAERKKLKIIAGAGAVGVDGRPLADSTQIDEVMVQRADARLAAATSAERSQTAKKAASRRRRSTAKKAVAKKSTAAKKATGSAAGPSGDAGEGNQS